MDEDIIAILQPAEILETPVSVSLDGCKTYMTELTINYSRDDAEKPALNSLVIQLLGRVAENCSILQLERASSTRWKYDGSVDLTVADPDGLTLVARSEDIGDIGHICLTKSEVDDLTTCALSNANLEFERQLATGKEEPTVTLSFKVCVIPPEENAVGLHDVFADAAMEDPKSLFSFASRLSDDNPRKPEFLNICGYLFLRRFNTYRDEDDINNSIIAFESAAQLSSVEDLHEYLPFSGDAFRERYFMKANLSDLDRAIEIFEVLAGSTPDGDPNMATQLNNVTSALKFRFEHTGELGDISKAITIQKKTILLVHAGDEILPMLWSNLGSSLVVRFNRTGNDSDLSEGISAHQKAIHLAPENSAHMPLMLGGLGNAYLRRFELKGDLADVPDAISVNQKSVYLTPEGDPELPRRLHNLGASFGSQFRRTGDINDVSEALSAYEKAINFTPEGHPNLPQLLNSLGVSLVERFKMTKDRNDITEAISSQQKGVLLLPEGHIKKPKFLESLGRSFTDSFRQTGDPKEISEAISVLQKAVLLTPEGDGNRMRSVFRSLGSSFTDRYRFTGDINDNSEAISAYQKAIRLTPEGHVDMHTLLNNLGISFFDRFSRTGDSSSLATAMSNYRLAATSSTGIPIERLPAAESWATCSQIFDPPQALDAWNTVIELLAQVVGMEQTIERRHENLVKFSHLPTSAAAAAFSLGRPKMALEWLEQGRCLVWSQLNNLRTPLDELYTCDPVSAKEFSRVSRALENAGSRAESSLIRAEGTMEQKMSLQDETNAHIKLSQERDQLLKKIRDIPRFSNFLRPPQCSNLLSDLPKDGLIVVINVHKDRCDAVTLVAGADNPLHIPLSNFYTQVQKLQRDMYHYLSLNGVLSRGFESDSEVSQVRALRMRAAGLGIRDVLRDVLRELWLLVVKPVLDGLPISMEIPTADPLHIWWCPTGPLAFLPIHAAGLYDHGDMLGACLTDFAISSYIPTVSILVERVKKARTLNESVHNGLLLISVPESPVSPHLARIPGTRREIESIQQHLHGGGFRIFSLSGDSATVDNVMGGMESYSCIHLACHATQELDNPLKSGFYLHNGRLELSEVIKKQVATSDFAFLSACQTSTGHATLSEEAVHLAAGMLAAGYQGVVGTMWAIQDYYGPEIAKEFYTNLISHVVGNGRKKGLNSGGAAHALHYAIKQIRKIVGDSEMSLLIWVPYVHFGF